MSLLVQVASYQFNELHLIFANIKKCIYIR